MATDDRRVQFDGTLRAHGQITVHTRITDYKQITVLRKSKVSPMVRTGSRTAYSGRFTEDSSINHPLRCPGVSLFADDLLSRAMTSHTSNINTK